MKCTSSFRLSCQLYFLILAYFFQLLRRYPVSNQQAAVFQVQPLLRRLRKSSRKQFVWSRKQSKQSHPQNSSYIKVNYSNLTLYYKYTNKSPILGQPTVRRVFFQTSVVCHCYCFSGSNGQDTLLWQA